MKFDFVLCIRPHKAAAIWMLNWRTSRFPLRYMQTHFLSHCMTLVYHCAQSAENTGHVVKAQQKLQMSGFFFFFASYLATGRQRDLSPPGRSKGAAAAVHTCRSSKQSTLTTASLYTAESCETHRADGESTSSSSLLPLTVSGESTWTAGKQREVK